MNPDINDHLTESQRAELAKWAWQYLSAYRSARVRLVRWGGGYDQDAILADRNAAALVVEAVCNTNEERDNYCKELLRNGLGGGYQSASWLRIAYIASTAPAWAMLLAAKRATEWEK